GHAIGDHMAPVYREIRPQILLDRPLGCGLSCPLRLVWPVGKPNPARNDFLGKAIGRCVRDRVGAWGAARSPLDLSAKCEPSAVCNEGCAPRDERAVDSWMHNQFDGHVSLSPLLLPTISMPSLLMNTLGSEVRLAKMKLACQCLNNPRLNV